MTTVHEVERISTTDVAVLIRAALKQAFAGTKFSVRTSYYSMGSHVRVSWTDGPAPRQIDAVIGRFCGKTFDGMDDSTHYHDTDHEGRRVHFSGSQPHTSREVTDFDARVAAAKTMILATCDGITGEPGREQFGRQWVNDLARAMVWGADYRQAEWLPAAFRRVIMREEG